MEARSLVGIPGRLSELKAPNIWEKPHLGSAHLLTFAAKMVKVRALLNQLPALFYTSNALSTVNGLTK